MDSNLNQNKKNKNLIFILLLIIILSFILSLFFIIWESKRFKLKEKKIIKKTYSLKYRLNYSWEDQFNKFKEYRTLLKKKKYRKARMIFRSLYFPSILKDIEYFEKLKLSYSEKRDYQSLILCNNHKEFIFSPHYNDILKICATIYRENKRWTKVKKILDENRKIFLKEKPELYLFLRAELLKKNRWKNRKSIERIYKDILIKYPQSEFEKIIIKQNYNILKKLSLMERIERIKNLINNRKYKKAFKELSRLKNSNEKNYLIGLTYYKRGMLTFSEKWLQNVDFNSPEGVSACKYLLRISYRRTKLLKIDNIYNECLREGANKELLREIMGDFYFSNLILYRAKFFYKKAVDSKVKLTQGEEIKRRLAWIYLAFGEKEKTFEYYKERYLYKDGITASDMFWFATLKEDIYGKDKETKEIFAKLAEDYYYHYYGQNSLKKLSKKVKKRIENILEKRDLDLPFTNFLLREFKRLDFLYKNGLRRYFLREISYLSNLYGGEELKYYQLDELRRLDNLYLLLRKRLELKNPYSAKTPIKYLYYTYPLPGEYFSIIKNESKQYKIDPFLIISLIRQESLFNKDAKSYAGARGLMQLMYYTAKKLAKELKYRRIRAKHLYIPETNLKLGIYYLKKLSDRYGKDNLPYILAAYNAGEHRVDYWKKVLKEENKEEFVELIPFTQTRKYVKLILTNYFIYKKIYSE